MSNFFSPIIGISTGDPNGIGIEVILKSLEKINFIGKFIPVIFSNYKLFLNIAQAIMMHGIINKSIV